MGVGRAGQVLPGLTWVIVLSMRSQALRERSPASAGALLLLQGDVDGGRASQWGSVVEAQRRWPAMWAATDGHAATPSLSL